MKEAGKAAVAVPTTEIVFFTEDGVSSPVLDWLDELPTEVQIKVTERVMRLETFGHELRRPAADTLRDGVHELRARFRNVQYRVLYFFSMGKAVLSHGLVKRGRTVPDREIDLALDRKRRFDRDPAAHTYRL